MIKDRLSSEKVAKKSKKLNIRLMVELNIFLWNIWWYEQNPPPEIWTNYLLGSESLLEILEMNKFSSFCGGPVKKELMKRNDDI